MNMHYSSRKRKNPKGNSEIIWTTTSTTGPEYMAWVARLPPSWFQRKESTALQEVHKKAFIDSRVGRTPTEQHSAKLKGWSHECETMDDASTSVIPESRAQAYIILKL